MTVQQESVVTPERLAQGITWQEWMDKIERNKDKFQENYDETTLNADDVAAIKELMAMRGPDTLRHGPLKPKGLRDPRTEKRPWAVIQLRQDDASGSLWSMVGFQTRMRHGEQQRIFRSLPGLGEAEFVRLGTVHRNTFIDSPRCLNATLEARSLPGLFFAGQMTGVEGYVESAAIGLLAGCFAAAEHRGQELAVPPETTALGALHRHITGGADAETFQPMNVNFGLFPPLPIAVLRRKGADRKKAHATRALADLGQWLKESALFQTAA